MDGCNSTRSCERNSTNRGIFEKVREQLVDKHDLKEQVKKSTQTGEIGKQESMSANTSLTLMVANLANTK